MQRKVLKIEYVLTIILLLGFWKPLPATHLNRSNRVQVCGIPSTGYLMADSSLPARDAGLKKYAYAELLYQVHYSIPKLMLSGKTISEEMKTAVNAARNRNEALDLLGELGWELVSVITRNFDGGFELFFYLKKPVG